MPAGVGESDEGQKDTKDEIEAAIKAAYGDDYEGPDIAEERPQGILNQELLEFSRWVANYSPDQARDDRGRWTSGGAETSRVTEQRAKEHYAELKDAYLKKGGGTYDTNGNLTSVVLNTDEWRSLFPEYHGTNSADVHEAAAYLNKRLFADSLKDMKGQGNGKMVVLAGGGGSGKGTAVGQFFDESKYPIRVDQVSDQVEKLTGKLDEAKAAGFKPEYIFIDRKPEDAWHGVVSRAVNARARGELARTVPLEIALKANLEARTTAIALLKGRPDLQPQVIDNNRGRGKAVLITDRVKAIAHLEQQTYDHPKLLEKLRNDTLGLYESGKIPKDIAVGLVGQSAVNDRRAQLR